MKRGLKKKGSSLVAVLVICSIILVTATTMIGVATTDVRMRMNESKKLQNMYKADSGLEIFNNIILKDSEAAIVYAQNKVQANNLIGGAIANTSDEDIYNTLNKDFKAYFIKALISGVTVTNEGTITGYQSLDDQYNNIAVDSRTDETIIIDQSTTNPVSTLLVSLKNYRYIKSLDAVTGITNEYKDAFGTAEKPVIKVFDIKYNDAEKSIKFTIRSSFSCAETSTTKLANKKVIETSFKITAPEYADIINRTNSSGEIDIMAPYSNVLTVDGNLNVNSTLTLGGNTWVKGDADTAASENQSIVFSKYNGGIKLASGKNITTNPVATTGTTYQGNIYTAGTFSLVNGSTATLSGNLYSSNTYIGPSSTNDSSSRDNTITVGDMITYNDLGINSLASKINMNNYYGINSTTTDSTNGGKNNASKRSSCIIINNYNMDSKLKINNDAYIAGVAYINTGNENSDNGEYETGESIAVRGNYKAYQEALTQIGETTINPGFKYYDPVSLLETINGQAATVQNKRDYFNEYYQHNVFKDGKVTIGGRVYSTGAIVTTDENKNANDLDIQDVNVINARRTYAQTVLSMNSDLSEVQLDNVYNNGTVIKTVKGSNGTTGVVNFDAMDPGVSVSVSNPGQGLVNALSNCAYVLGREENETIVISPGRISVEGHTEPPTGTACTQCFNFAQENGEDIVNAVIITKGNVKIEDGVNFKGCIIAGGNVEVEEGTEGVELTYNASVVGQIITVNHLSNYFNENMTVVERLTVNNGDIINIDPTETNSYNVDGVVNRGLWKLIENQYDR